MIRFVANPSNSHLCLSNVKQMNVGQEFGLTGGTCTTSQDCYLWSGGVGEGFIWNSFFLTALYI